MFHHFKTITSENLTKKTGNNVIRQVQINESVPIFGVHTINWQGGEQ